MGVLLHHRIPLTAAIRDRRYDRNAFGARWFTPGVEVLGVEVLGVEVLGAEVLGAAVLGAAVLNGRSAFRGRAVAWFRNAKQPWSGPAVQAISSTPMEIVSWHRWLARRSPFSQRMAWSRWN
jgi:hypothetical protein